MERKIAVSILLMVSIPFVSASDFQISSISHNQTLEENDVLEVEANITNHNSTGTQEVKLLKDSSKVFSQNLNLQANKSKNITLSYSIKSGDAEESADFTVKTENDTEPITVDIATLERHFSQGWNYFSLPIATQSRPSISAILEEDKVQAVWRYEDGGWESYAPEAQENPFNSFKGGEGYILEAKEEFTIRPNVQNTVDSESVENSNPASRELKKGWNLVGHYWAEPVGVSSALDSIKDENKGKIYKPKTGLALEKMSFVEPLRPSKAYWLMVKEDSIYVKDKISGSDYSVDWSTAKTYQIGENIQADNYNANITRVEGIVDYNYPSIRDMIIEGNFANENITLNQSFKGITFENELVTESGKEYDIDDTKYLRESMATNRYNTPNEYSSYVSIREIPASDEPAYIRTKVISERGLEGKFMYNISDYIQWEIPRMQKKAVKGSGLDKGRYLFKDDAEFKFTKELSSERARFQWNRIDKEEFANKTVGEVYIFNETDLADELNVSDNFYFDAGDLAREVGDRDREGKDVSTLDSARKICSTKLTKNGSFKCPVPDSLNTSKEFPLYWEVDRVEKLETERGSGSLQLVDKENFSQVSTISNVKVDLIELREVENRYGDDREFELDVRLENTGSTYVIPSFGLKTPSGSNGMGGSGLSPGETVETTEHLSLEDYDYRRLLRDGSDLSEIPEDSYLENIDAENIFLHVSVEEDIYDDGAEGEDLFYNVSSLIADEYLPELQANLTEKNNVGMVTKEGLGTLKLQKKEYEGRTDTYNESEMDRLLNNSNATVFISKRNKYYYEAKTEYSYYSDQNLEAYNETFTHKCKAGYNISTSSFSCNLSDVNLPAGYRYNVFWNISAEGDVSNTQGMNHFDLVKEYQINETANTDEVQVRIDDFESVIGYDERSEIQITSYLENINVTHPDGNTETGIQHYLLDSTGERLRYHEIEGPQELQKGESATRTRDTGKPDKDIKYVLTEMDRAGAGERRLEPVFLFNIGESFNKSSSDSSKPSLNNFSISPNVVNPLESFKISVNASDSNSGVFKANVIISNVHGIEREYTLTDFQNGTAEKNVAAPDTETTFSIDLEIFDEAGNEALKDEVGELRVK